MLMRETVTHNESSARAAVCTARCQVLSILWPASDMLSSHRPVPSGANGPSAAEDTAENAQQLLRLQSAAAASEPGGTGGTAAAPPPPAGMDAASPSAFARPSAFQAAALRSVPHTCPRCHTQLPGIAAEQTRRRQ